MEKKSWEKKSRVQQSDEYFQCVSFRGVPIYVVRDDLFTIEGHFAGEHALAGNKARKLYYYLQQKFHSISRVVSYGSAQSNMLYSLTVLAKIKGWQLDFYTDRIPKNLKENPRGNYGAALSLGANIKCVPLGQGQSELNPKAPATAIAEQYLQDTVMTETSDTLYIPLGGAGPEAEPGLRILAKQINAKVEENRLQNPKLMLPSGTGVSAFYLQKHLPFEVLTCACVSSEEYLEEQFEKIGDSSVRPTILPSLLDLSGHPRKFQFGKLYSEFFNLWEELKRDTGIVFELLYDPLGWMHMQAYIEQYRASKTGTAPDMIYLHQGGQLGNETMLQRYSRKRDTLERL